MILPPQSWATVNFCDIHAFAQIFPIVVCSVCWSQFWTLSQLFAQHCMYIILMWKAVQPEHCIICWPYYETIGQLFKQ